MPRTKRKPRPSNAIPVKLNEVSYAHVITALSEKEGRLTKALETEKIPAYRRTLNRHLKQVKSVKASITRQAQMNWNVKNGYTKRSFIDRDSPKRK